MLPVAAWLLALSGLVLVGMGAYFGLARPALLPEDARYMGTTESAVRSAAPNLAKWLKHVFWVMGGYIASTGVLVVYVAATAVRAGALGALAVLTVVWATSIGLMTLVNVLIDSDFKRPLAVLALIWATGLVLAGVAR